MNVVQDFFFVSLRFEHSRFCVVFVGLISVGHFVGSCCFWLLVVLILILFFLVLMEDSTVKRFDT